MTFVDDAAGLRARMELFGACVGAGCEDGTKTRRDGVELGKQRAYTLGSLR